LTRRHVLSAYCVSVVVLLLVVPWGAGLRAQECTRAVAPVLALTTTSGEIQVAGSASVYLDPGGAAEYDDVATAYRQGRFIQHCAADLQPSDPAAALWLRFEISRSTDSLKRWILTFGQSQIDEARLFLPQPGGLYVLKRSGRAVPASARDTISRWPAIGLELSANNTTPVFLRLSGVTAPYLSVQLVPERQFTDGESKDLLALAAVLGFMVAMLAYNFVIYIRSRLHQCLYYFLYLGFIIAHIAIYDGLVNRFGGVSVSGALADDLAQAFVIAAAVSLLLFGRLLLGLPETFPRYDKAILILTVVMTLALAFEMLHLAPTWLVTSAVALISGSLMCGLAVARALTGYRPAIYFSLSFFALLMGVVVDSVGFYFPVAISPDPSFWQSVIGVQQNWSFHIGICAEAVLISFAITYFIRDMQDEVLATRADSDTAQQGYQEDLAAMAHRVGVRERVAEKAADMLSPKPSDEALLEDAVRIVRANLTEADFDIVRLSRELAVSERGLRRRVAQVTGLSPVEFVRRERMEQARRYLETGTYKTIAEVARAVGIASPGYFSRVYRDAFGHTPKDALKNG
jgi:AraC-like DNA-binding protein